MRRTRLTIPQQVLACAIHSSVWQERFWLVPRTTHSLFGTRGFRKKTARRVLRLEILLHCPGKVTYRLLPAFCGEEGMTKTTNNVSDDNCWIVDLSNAALDITLQTRHVGSNSCNELGIWSKVKRRLQLANIFSLLQNHNALESTNEGGFDHVSRPRQSQIELGLVHVFVANEYRFAPSIEHTRRKNKK